MPMVSRRLLSHERLLRRRAAFERTRRSQGEPHRIRYFHQVDDPHSTLAAQALPRLARRYDVVIEPHLVGPPSDAAAPDRPRAVAWARRDAALLARRHDLAFVDPGRAPAPEAVQALAARLASAIDAGRFVDEAGAASAGLWARTAAEPAAHDLPAGAPGATRTLPEDATLARRLRQGDALRERLGQYLGATFHYGGEWYWGIDRLHHLEARLRELGAMRDAGAPAPSPLFPPVPDPDGPLALDDPPAIEFFFSLRSPYSALAAPRVLALALHAGADVHLRPVLPMVMRGLPVPSAKRRYIAADAAREARLHDLPFGTLNDPVGRPTERGLAVFAWADRVGRGPAFLLSFMHGVWAEGVDAGSDRGLRHIAERAGIAWSDCIEALADERWRGEVEAHREALFALGLWGVPSFRVGSLAVWGQDRLWAVREALGASAEPLR